MKQRSASRVLLAPFIRDFLEDRVEREQALSIHTRASYADTLRLLLVFVSERVKRSPSELQSRSVTSTGDNICAFTVLDTYSPIQTSVIARESRVREPLHIVCLSVMHQ